MHWFSGARFDRYCPNWRIPPLEVTNDRSIYGFCAAQFDRLKDKSARLIWSSVESGSSINSGVSAAANKANGAGVSAAYSEQCK